MKGIKDNKNIFFYAIPYEEMSEETKNKYQENTHLKSKRKYIKKYENTQMAKRKRPRETA